MRIQRDIGCLIEQGPCGGDADREKSKRVRLKYKAVRTMPLLIWKAESRDDKAGYVES